MPPFLPRKRLRSGTPEVDSAAAPSEIKGKGRDKAVAAKSRKPTLFDALDAGVSSSGNGKNPKKLLAKLAGSSDDSSELSSLSESEPELEDVPRSKRQKLQHMTPTDEEEEDEDIEFEDVRAHTLPTAAAPPPSGDLDLTLTRETRISVVNPHGKKQGPSKIERGIRVATHQMHVMFLMWHNAVRNAWISDKEVQDILVSQLGPGLKEEIDKWRVSVGLQPIGGPKPKLAVKGPGKKGKNHKQDARSQRDWGQPAESQSSGGLDRGHAARLVRLIRFMSVYWKKKFGVTEPGLKKMGYMSLPRIDEEIKSFYNDEHDPELHGERIASIGDFRKRAASCEGSRDLSAQLFTALLRGIGIEARLVASLQPAGFGWSKNEEASEKKKKKNKMAVEAEAMDDMDDDTSDVVMEDIIERKIPIKVSDKGLKNGLAAEPKVKSKYHKRKPVRRIARASGSKNAPIDMSASDAEIQQVESQEDNDSVIDVTPAKPRPGASKSYEKDLSPNYWSEILSPYTNTYVPCSTLLQEVCATNDKLLAWFEPRGAKADKAKQVMAYIIGYSSDGSAKDITVRYLKNHMWPGKTKGMRMPVEKVPIYGRHGKVKRYEEFDWFKTVMSGYVRRDNKRTDADDVEEATDLRAVKPQRKEAKEGEETLQSYKSSAEFVLERHLRREEAVRPGTQHVKMFTMKGKGKGQDAMIEEKVFLRKDVVKCKSVETWHKEGRAPSIGEQPMKRVPYRAATTNRKRELAEAELASGGEKMLQGLYSWDQTDWIIPPPIENGMIPKNSYGNMDVYVPSMVPVGATHIPRRGTMKICKRLGIDFAEAVTGFEFGARMAIPVITGVVIAEENEEMVMEEWEKDEAERVRKEDEKRTKAALGMWRKFLMGLRIVERVREEYGDEVDGSVDLLNPWTNKNKKMDEVEAESRRRIMDQHDEDMAGGFLPEGHNEEEAPQGFFPVRHEEDDDDDEDGGGFIVEGHEQTDAATNRLRPPSITIEADAHGITGSLAESDDEDITRGAPQPKKGKATAARPTKHATAIAQNKNKTTRASQVSVTKSVKALPRKQTHVPKASSRRTARVTGDTEEEIDDSQSPSSLSDLESEEEEAPAPKSARARKATVAAAQPLVKRDRPKRQAARRSETALKSHYFEHSDAEDNDEE